MASSLPVSVTYRVLGPLAARSLLSAEGLAAASSIRSGAAGISTHHS
jgi:hypothetical protein